MLYNEINNNKKKWIVLIHCVCGNERIFSKQMNVLKKMYNIAIIRLPGHGIDSTIEESTFENVIKEIHEFVLAKGQKTDIMGLSLGAMIATEYILRYEKDVNNAYLIGNIYGFSIPIFKFGYMTLLKIHNIIPRQVYMYFITRAILPGNKQTFQRKKLYASSRSIEKDILHKWMSEMGQFILYGKEKLRLTMQSSVNIKLIYGSKDYMFLNWVKRRLNKNQRAKLIIVENAGHLCNVDQAEKINMLIGDDNNETFSNN